MAFKLKSGNRTSFKTMGGTDKSPAKDMKTGKYEHSFESPAKQKVDPDAPGTPGKPGYEPPVKRSDFGEKGKAIWDAQRAKKKKSPTGQWKGTEGQDQDKILDDKGNHIGNWVNDKKVMFDDKPAIDPKYKPRSNEERNKLIKNMEKKNLKTLRKSPGKAKKLFGEATIEGKESPAKQTATTWADGTKKSPRQIEEQKIHPDEYWYKINNKPATKAEYIKYQNKPGGDESGKQTNDPTVSLAKQSADKRIK